MKKDFDLPEEDIDYLNSHFSRKWEAITNNNQKYLIIRNYPLPEGYNHKEVSLMVMIPENYPPNQLDMFYVCLEVAKLNNQTIPCVGNETHLGETWQRWSRHYQWDTENDSLITHLLRIAIWIEKEVSN